MVSHQKMGGMLGAPSSRSAWGRRCTVVASGHPALPVDKLVAKQAALRRALSVMEA